MVAISLVQRRLTGLHGACPSVAGIRVGIGIGVGPGIGRRFSLGNAPCFGVG
ncbi:hypothetical protein [Paraburkholderia sediminicola]|uniref:hypothetical protein n=1 Tax=Paraburkholderia sediminicola TaxID=458836 RepID=UPI0038BC0493